MGKKLLLLFAVVLSILRMNAQTSQVATLSHEGNITTFYSGNAFKDAYAAAVDGDIITLSSGSFEVCDIKKSITVRGAGMMPDNEPTIFTASLRVNDGVAATLEGLLLNGGLVAYTTNDCRIVKCYISTFSSGSTKNITFLHCIIDDYSSTADGTAINSYIHFRSLGHLNMTNCILVGNNVGDINYSNLVNCILADEGESTYLSNTTTASHSYYIGKSTEVFKNSPATSNVILNDINIEDIYKEGDNDTYMLKDEYAQSWLGSDGTQVGVNGGSIPFDPTPTNPQITKFNVAPKTTADGKLSVDIEVKAN